MPKAIRVHETGSADKLIWEDFDPGAPGPGEVRLKQTSIGVNFLDIYHRAGTHHMPLDPLPAIPGVEAAGVIEALGEGVTDFAEGDRVAYPITVGSYAEVRVMPTGDLVRVPDNISDDVAAAIMLKGMTTEYLLNGITQIKAGDTVLIHAAAGGVGLIACQWAKHLGATVIGTCSSDEKAELIKAQGCDHAIVYTREDFAARVKDITDGKGCRAVYDSVGKDTFMGSLASVAPYGTVACFGLASGPLPAIGFADFPMSSYVTRATVRSITDSREALLKCSSALFDVISSGAVKPVISATYALSDAAEAHRAMEARLTTGSLVLKV